mgnify:CR=1 FL=1
MNEFLAEFWIDFSDPKNFIGHVAYVLLILSMMMRNMNWLRFFAIMAGSISAVFYFTINDFVSMFCRHSSKPPDTEVTRIEFKYL